jgi:acid phosphatase (class A)
MNARLQHYIPGILVLMMFAVTAQAKATYVKAKDFDFQTLLPAPPAIGSEQAKQEIDQMLVLQAKRTDADVKRIKIESKMTGFSFSDSVGSWFNPDDLPATADLLTKVLADSKTVCSAAKEVFQRKRPYLTDSRIKPCEEEDTFSYPSSHSTRATVLGMVVCQICPDQKDAIMAQARLIGDDRALAGQHFPSDVAAGRILGRAIFDKMMENPDFQTDLAAAIKECTAKEPAKK